MTLKEELDHGVLAKVAEDEPIFVLRAKDITAPGIVQLWTMKAMSNGAPKEKIAEARACRLKMIGWQVKNGAKRPD